MAKYLSYSNRIELYTLGDDKVSLDYNVTYRKKDKSIQCIISYKDENGKWRQKSKQGFKAQKDAKPWINKTLEELEDKIRLYDKIDPALKNMTFKELMDKFIAHKKLHREQNTVEVIQYARKKFESLENSEVIKISKADIQYCVDLMVKEELSHNTLSSYIGSIKSAFIYAIEDIEIIKDNPFSKITIPEKKSEKKIKALNKSELDDLINEIDNPTYKMITMLAGKTGLRIGEILGLTWDDVDTQSSTLEVNKQLKLINDKEFGIGDVKRENSNRIVPIPTKSLTQLKKYKKLMPIHTTKRIFYTRNDTRGISADLAKLYRKLGYDISIHDLRHTYATHLVANGLDFKTVAQLMGHDVQETLKTYSHVTDDMLERATNIINNIFK